MKTFGTPAPYHQLLSWASGLKSVRIGQVGLSVAELVLPSLAPAWPEAPGEAVVIPGTTIPDWGQVGTVPGRFGRPTSSAVVPKVSAVLILHGANGVDGRGAFYAAALQEAGIATLEITMFPPGRSPRAGLKATMPHAAAALTWLAAQPTVDGDRLGVMGFSYGGMMAVYLASELVQERLGKEVPAPAAFAPLYPVCSEIAKRVVSPQHPFYNTYLRMRAVPMLIQVGTYDALEEGERPCDPLISTWPTAARELTTVRYFEAATHAFDAQTLMVNVRPNAKDAAAAREAVVSFFVKYLTP